MKKIIKIAIYSFILSTVIFLSLKGLTFLSNAGISDITWEYDELTKTLTIKGTGEITTSIKTENDELIEKVIIEEGITGIENSIFAGYPKMKDLVLPKSIISMRESIFNSQKYYFVYYNGSVVDWCNISFQLSYSNPMGYAYDFYFLNENGEYYELTELVLDDNITNIGSYQFCGLETIEKVYLSQSIISINKGAFKNVSFTDLYYGGTLADWCNITFSDEYSNPMRYAKSFNLLDENLEYQEITDLVIPNTVTEIKPYAFYETVFFERMYLSQSVKKFSYNSINNLRNLTDLYYDGTIEDWCNILFFEDESNPLYYAENFYMFDASGEYELVKDITIPETITTIKQNTFINYGFDTIILKADNVNILDDAFYNCNIKNLYISSMKPIDSWTFFNAGVVNIYYAMTLLEWCNAETNEIISIPNHFYLLDANGEYFELVDVIIPEGVTEIKSNLFNGCRSIKTVVLPNSVTIIGDSAFDNCYNMESIEITSSVTSFNEAFYYSANIMYYKGTLSDWCKIDFKSERNNPMYYINKVYMLDENGEYYLPKELDLPKDLKTIGIGQFAEMGTLDKVIIPNSVAIIEEDSFYNTYITDCYYEGTIEDWCNIQISGTYYGLPFQSINNFYCLNENNEFYMPTTITIPGTIKEVKHNQFHSLRQITELILEEGVEVLQGDAFSNCSSLTKITLPKSIKEINTDYESIQEVYYNGTITDWCSVKMDYYYYNILYNATKIVMRDKNGNYATPTEVVVPDTITEIGIGQFYNFRKLKSVTIPDSVTAIKDSAFYNCSELTTVNISSNSSLIAIGNEAFANCEKLTNFHIPSSVTNIGFDAFLNCKSLTNITIPEGVSMLNSSVFEGCENLANVQLPSSLKEIEIYAFKNCKKLVNIYLPKTIQGARLAFIGSGLQNVYYEGTIEDWCNIKFTWDEFNPMYTASHLYLLNTNGEFFKLTNLVIPESITSIGDCQFYGMQDLETVIFHENIVSIGEQAFEGCSKLEEIRLPDSLQKMEDYAINCSNLRTLYIGENLQTSNLSYLQSKEKLEEITVHPNNLAYYSDDYGVLYNKDQTKMVVYPRCAPHKYYVIPSTVESFSFFRFYKCLNLESLTVPQVCRFNFVLDECVNTTVYYYKNNISEVDLKNEKTYGDIKDYQAIENLDITSIEVIKQPLFVNRLTEDTFEIDDMTILASYDGGAFLLDKYQVRITNATCPVKLEVSYEINEQVVTTDIPYYFHNYEEGYCNICERIMPTIGDVDDNLIVNSDDAINILMYTIFPESYPLNQICDYDKDGVLDSDDAIYLLMYTIFPDDYPLE